MGASHVPVVSGQEDSEGSSGETAEAPAPGNGAPRPWGPGAPTAPPPCSGECQVAGALLGLA